MWLQVLEMLPAVATPLQCNLWARGVKLMTHTVVLTPAVLAAAKGVVVEYSIQEAYIAAIRRAERFLYIENQYFLGSSHAWPNYTGAGACTHLVPIEIALKIAHQIRAGKRFCVYVVLPMWPEGEPLPSPRTSKSRAFEENSPKETHFLALHVDDAKLGRLPG